MAKKSERKRLVERLDKAFGDYIKARDGKCVVCGSTENLQCGHLFSRVAYSTRWNPANAYCQCRSCNLVHEHDFYRLYRYAVQVHGADEMDRLHSLYMTPVKLSNNDLELLISEFGEAT